MKRLSKPAFQAAIDWIQENGRPLEQALIQYYFFEGAETAVLEALAEYQNEDGGFGNGLEADFRLPDSSPLATTVAMQHLIHFAQYEPADKMISKAIDYLEHTFDEKRGGWYAVPEAVNDYPHAFWWTVQEDGMSLIDHHWGNPNAEIIGYLSYYKSKAKKLNVDKLLDQAINHLLNLEGFQSEHEIYCYLRMFTLISEHRTKEVKQQLQRAIESLVQFDQAKWKEYVPFPLKFVHAPSSETFGIPSEDINKNLDYLIEQFEREGKISPNWKWNDYLDVWEQAKVEWTGALTVDTLQTLKRFDRLES
ncbi:hypothetical protein [Metabacillus sp. Hm71]|uniref:hypothetical protein n=1 Tax=Metabacillus sp. Hm71 TaxID=3450743 RepID=UPI003F42FBB8